MKCDFLLDIFIYILYEHNVRRLADASLEEKKRCAKRFVSVRLYKHISHE